MPSRRPVARFFAAAVGAFAFAAAFFLPAGDAEAREARLFPFFPTLPAVTVTGTFTDDPLYELSRADCENANANSATHRVSDSGGKDGIYCGGLRPFTHGTGEITACLIVLQDGFNRDDPALNSPGAVPQAAGVRAGLPDCGTALPMCDQLGQRPSDVNNPFSHCLRDECQVNNGGCGSRLCFDSDHANDNGQGVMCSCRDPRISSLDGFSCVDECPPGQESDGVVHGTHASPSCVACPEQNGVPTFNPASGGTCGQCVGGTVNPARTACQCPGNLQLTDGTCGCPLGSVLAKDGMSCLAACPPGRESDGAETRPQCRDCDSGEYNADEGGVCQVCDTAAGFQINSQNGLNIGCECAPNLKLSSIGSACLAECPTGEEFNATAAQCQACPPGQFNPTEGGQCRECVGGSVGGFGSVCQCSAPMVLAADGQTCAPACPAGQQNTGGECEICGLGFYNPAEGGSCLQCGNNGETRRNGTPVDQAATECVCDSGYALNPAGTCERIPDCDAENKTTTNDPLTCGGCKNGFAESPSAFNACRPIADCAADNRRTTSDPAVCAAGPLGCADGFTEFPKGATACVAGLNCALQNRPNADAETCAAECVPNYADISGFCVALSDCETQSRERITPQSCGACLSGTHEVAGVCRETQNCAARNRRQSDPVTCGACLPGHSDAGDFCVPDSATCAALNRAQAGTACGACLPGHSEAPGGRCETAYAAGDFQSAGWELSGLVDSRGLRATAAMIPLQRIPDPGRGLPIAGCVFQAESGFNSVVAAARYPRCEDVFGRGQIPPKPPNFNPATDRIVGWSCPAGQRHSPDRLDCVNIPPPARGGGFDMELPAAGLVVLGVLLFAPGTDFDAFSFTPSAAYGYESGTGSGTGDSGTGWESTGRGSDGWESLRYGMRLDYRQDAWAMWWLADETQTGWGGEWRGELFGGAFRAAADARDTRQLSTASAELGAEWIARNGLWNGWKLSPTWRFAAEGDKRAGEWRWESGADLTAEWARAGWTVRPAITADNLRTLDKTPPALRFQIDRHFGPSQN